MNANDLQDCPWFQELKQNVEAELAKLETCKPDRRQALLTERGALEANKKGWLESLSKPSLDSGLRQAIEEQFQQASERIESISAELSQDESIATQYHRVLDPEIVLEKLNRLEEILAGNNPSAGNLLLSQHIDGILCDSDGQVVVRTCKLGALAGAVELMPRGEPELRSCGNVGDQMVHVANPRKRSRRKAAGGFEDDDELQSANEFATDPRRFSGLGAEWFTEDVFQVPRTLCWAEAHAREVAEYRLQTRASIETTAKHFRKTTPTIRKALKYALELGIDATGKTLKLPKGRHWVIKNANLVAEFFADPSRQIKDAVEHFGISAPTILKALDRARRIDGPEPENREAG